MRGHWHNADSFMSMRGRLQQHCCGERAHLLDAGVRECNRSEVIFLPPAAVSPSVEFGATVDAACSSSPGHAVSLAQLHSVYAAERYMLSWRDGRGYVLLRSNHAGHDLLKVRQATACSLCHIGVMARGAPGKDCNARNN